MTTPQWFEYGQGDDEATEWDPSEESPSGEWTDDDAPPEPPPLTPIAADPADWLPVYSDQVLTAQWVEPAWLVPGLELGPGRPAGIIGLPHSGKNDTAQALALAVMSGRAAFELPEFLPARRGRVLHLTYDMGGQATSLRYRRLGAGMNLDPEELQDRIVVCPYPRIRLTSSKAREAYERVVRGFDLVILDNLRAATPGADENSSSVGDYLQIFGAACERAGATGLFLVHAKKAGDAGGAAAIRGSNAIEGASGVLLQLEGKGSDPRKLTCVRKHDMSRHDTPPVWLTLGPPPAVHAWDIGAHAPLRLIASLSEPLSPARAAGARDRMLEALRESPGASTRALVGSGGNKTANEQALKALLAEGAIVDRAPRGSRGAVLHLAEGEDTDSWADDESLDYSGGEE